MESTGTEFALQRPKWHTTKYNFLCGPVCWWTLHISISTIFDCLGLSCWATKSTQKCLYFLVDVWQMLPK